MGGCPFYDLEYSDYINCVPADDDETIECPIAYFCINKRSEHESYIMNMIEDCVNAADKARRIYEISNQ